MPCTPEIRLPIDCSRLRQNPGKYVRPGAQPANTDIKTYDCGNLYVSQYGLEANSGTLGELRVRYCVRLSEPVLENSSIVGGVVHFQGTVPTTGNNFATMVQQPGATPALSGITLGSNTIVFPAGIPGNYFVYSSATGSTSAAASSYNGGLAGTGVTAKNFFAYAGSTDAEPFQSSLAGTAHVAATSVATFAIGSAGGTVTLNPGAIVGGEACDLWIVSLPASVLSVTGEQKELEELKDQVAELRSLVMGPRALTTLPSLRGASEGGPEVVISEPATPDECKGADLNRSVHIPRSMAEKLLRAVGAQ